MSCSVAENDVNFKYLSQLSLVQYEVSMDDGLNKLSTRVRLECSSEVTFA